MQEPRPDELRIFGSQSFSEEIKLEWNSVWRRSVHKWTLAYGCWAVFNVQMVKYRCPNIIISVHYTVHHPNTFMSVSEAETVCACPLILRICTHLQKQSSQETTKHVLRYKNNYKSSDGVKVQKNCQKCWVCSEWRILGGSSESFRIRWRVWIMQRWICS